MSKVIEMLRENQRLILEQRTMYVRIANELNSNFKEVISDKNTGNQLGNAIINDIAGQITATYFSSNNLNITVDQILRRTLNFSYQNDYDPLSNEIARKDPMNATITDEATFNSVINGHQVRNLKNSNQVFEKMTSDGNYEKIPREKDKVDASDITSNRAQQNYRNQILKEKGNFDELTQKQISGKTEADHVLSRASFRSFDFLSEEGTKKLAKFSKTATNFQLINIGANRLKSDNKILDGDVDITAVATADQLTNNMVKKLEAGKDSHWMSEPGFRDQFDSQGHVKESVKKEIRNNAKKAINARDKIIADDYLKHGIKNMNRATKGALSGEYQYKKNKNGEWVQSKRKRGGVSDLFIGQLLYYGIPPVIFEVRNQLTKKKNNVDAILMRLKKSTKRIATYVISKMKNILVGVGYGLLRNIVRNFFNMLISALAGVLKRVFTILKSFTMSVISSVKILTSKNMTAQEKNSAITSLMASTTISVIVTVLIELLPSGLDWAKIPLQIIITAILGNMAMKILEKADLFNIKYGMSIAKIQKLFEDSMAKYNSNNKKIVDKFNYNVNELEKDVREITSVTRSLKLINFYKEDATDSLNKINEFFNMGIDFDYEWKIFAGME